MPSHAGRYIEVQGPEETLLIPLSRGVTHVGAASPQTCGSMTASALPPRPRDPARVPAQVCGVLDDRSSTARSSTAAGSSRQICRRRDVLCARASRY